MGDQLIVGAATYTTHNTFKRERETSLLTAGFEPAISASELPPTYALDRAANEIGNLEYIKKINKRTAVVNTEHREQSEKTTTGSSMKKLQEHNFVFSPLKPELNSICYLLALLSHHFLHVSRIRVKSLTLR
jgi:hypothetical protein